ncbi:MAG: hypothetical protein ABH863_01995, partial [Candidatus Micrarchaeota archaeon]
MELSGKEAFSFAAFVLMLFELFVPFASASYYYGLYDDQGTAGAKTIYFADEPEPMLYGSSGSCSMDEMDAAEVARYQKGLMNFQTEQISTLSDENLRKNDPTNQTSQNINININLADLPVYPVRDIANLLEYDEQALDELAKEFNVDKETGKLTREQVRAVAARAPGGQDKLSQALGIASAGDIPKPPYDAYKVVLPNGQSVPLNDIMKQQPQDKENQCLIDRSFIHGKVTFQALLNKDLYLGFDQSKTTVKAPQHLTSSQTTAALN